MKVCPKCGSQMNDTDLFCQTCGMSFGGGAPHENPQQPNGGQQNNWQQPAYHFDPYDHTAEFDAKDISDNKVIAMLCYLLGAAGVIIALLGSQSSPYAGFHVRQSLKFTVVDILLGIISAVLFWHLSYSGSLRHLLCRPVRCPHHLLFLHLQGTGKGAADHPLARLPAIKRKFCRKKRPAIAIRAVFQLL